MIKQCAAVISTGAERNGEILLVMFFANGLFEGVIREERPTNSPVPPSSDHFGIWDPRDPELRVPIRD